MKVNSRPASRSIGMEFERRAEDFVKYFGYETCTPRGTAKLARIGPGRPNMTPVHSDFFGLFDGIGHSQSNDTGFSNFVFWQTKKDWLKWRYQNAGRELLNRLKAFRVPENCSKWLLYEKDGQVARDIIKNLEAKT